MNKILFFYFFSFGLIVSCSGQNNNPLIGKWVVTNINSQDNIDNTLLMLAHMDGEKVYHFKKNGEYSIDNSQNEILKTGRYIVENDSLFFYDEDKIYKSKIKRVDSNKILSTNSEGTITEFKKLKTPPQ